MSIIKPAILSRGPVTVPVLGNSIKLTDRCDNCGHQAFARFTKDNLVLLFCAHHTYVLEATLIGLGWDMHDERHRLHSPEG